MKTLVSQTHVGSSLHLKSFFSDLISGSKYLNIKGSLSLVLVFFIEPLSCTPKKIRWSLQMYEKGGVRSKRVIHNCWSFLCEASTHEGRVECRLVLASRSQREFATCRMGKGAFPLFTLELCPAMLNPPAFISTLGYHPISPSDRVMKWEPLRSPWLILG